MKVDICLRKRAFTLNAKAEWPDTGTTVIAGPSGAGKTSLLRAVLGLERALGRVEFAGKILQDAQTFTPVHHRRMAWVSQYDDVFSHLSVRENLQFAKRLAAPGGAGLNETAKQFALYDCLQQNARTLSGGQKQRLILARAVLSNPCLLALDEPFSALDAEARHNLLSLLHNMCAKRNLPLLFVSHDFDTLTRLADFMVYMKDGDVFTQGALNTCLLDTDLPYRHREDACVVLHAIAKRYEAQDGLNVLDLGGAKLFTPGKPLPQGQGVRLRLRAADISLSRTRHDDSSVLNIVPTTVKNIEHASDKALHSPGIVTVTLNLLGMQVLARITEKSARILALKLGDEVFAQFKASALGAR